MDNIVCKTLNSISFNIIDQCDKSHNICFDNFVNLTQSSVTINNDKRDKFNDNYKISIELECSGYQMAIDKDTL